MRDTGFELVTSGAPLGAELRGVDAAHPLSAAAQSAVQEALDGHAVVVLRDQHLTPAQQIAFAARFAPLDHHVLHQFLLPGYPELLVVSNIVENGAPVGLADAGSKWHTDMSYMREPTYLSMLYAIEVPHDDRGEPLGSTRFVSTAHAYETLPAAMRQRIEGRRAVHSYMSRYTRRQAEGGLRPALTEGQLRRTEDVDHPIVRTHPRTGRKSLYVNGAYCTSIVDMPQDEGATLLAALYAHITRAETEYRHRWQVGDLLMWDNVATQHLASFDYQLPQRRRMHRTSSKGSVPI